MRVLIKVIDAAGPIPINGANRVHLHGRCDRIRRALFADEVGQPPFVTHPQAAVCIGVQGGDAAEPRNRVHSPVAHSVKRPRGHPR